MSSDTPDPISVTSSSPRTTDYDDSHPSYTFGRTTGTRCDHAPLERFENVKISQFTGGGVHCDMMLGLSFQ